MPPQMLAVVFIGAFLLVFGLWVILRGFGESKDSRLQRRLEGKAAAVPQAEAAISILRQGAGGQAPMLKRSIQRLPFVERVRILLEQADLSVQPGSFILVVVLLGLFGFIMGWLVGNTPIHAIAFALLLGVLPYMAARIKRAKRINAFTEQFPDALELMGNSLRAGHAFTASLNVVSEEMTEPIASEFRRVFEEQNYGMQLEDAMLSMGQRIDSLDLKFFTIAVLIQKETGGNMAEILDKISYTIRERFKILGQVKTLTAQGRLSGWVLGFLPLGLGTALYLMNPDYIGMLFHHPLGKTMLTAAGVMQVTGFLFIRKIINIKV